MSTPNGDDPSPYDLELAVRTELILAETSQSDVAVEGVPAVDWPLDPEAQRYEADLRTLLGAVEALRDGARPATSEDRNGGPQDGRD